MNNVLSYKKNRFKKTLLDHFTSYLFILPVLLGIILFTLVPMVSSLYYSMTEYYSIYQNPTQFIWFDNYIKAFTTDSHSMLWSLARTGIYTVFSMIFSLVLSYILALALVNQTKGIKYLRTLIYLPVLIPAVVGSMLWINILDYEYGIANMMLQAIGLPKYGFYSTESTSLPTFIGMGLFGLGGGMVLWIAQIKAIPDTLYEAAKLEGAGYFCKLMKITVPLCAPMIFYNLVLGIINSLQVFASAYMLTTPATGGALNFFSVLIYNTAFGQFDMGYACALSWILFAIILLLTVVVFKTSGWVYYGESE